MAVSLPADPDEGNNPRTSNFLYSLRALKNHDFAIFWTAAFITNAGGWFQSLAVPFVLYLITQNAVWVGLATVAQFLPILLVGPIAGVLAERGNIRITLFITQLIRSIVAMGMFLIWILGWHDPLTLLALATVTGFAQGISMPSWQAFVARLSTRETLSSAVMLNTIQFNLARSFGPALGGVLLLLWGPAWAFLVTVLAVLSVVIAVVIVKDPTQSGAERQARRSRADRAATQSVKISTLRQFATAWTYSRNQPGIVLAFVLVFCVGTLGMPIFQHVIVFSESVFHSGELGLAMMNLALGVGTIIAIPLVGDLEARLGRARLVAWSVPLYGIALLGFAAAPNTAAACLALVFIGVFFLATLSMGNNTVQLIVADRMRGRVLAMNVMVYTGSVAVGGFLFGGVLSSFIGPRPAVVVGGTALILFGIGFVLLRGRFAHTHLDDPHDSGLVPHT